MRNATRDMPRDTLRSGMQQGDVIIGVGSTLLDSTMSYDACLALVKSACKKADEDYDDPFIVRPPSPHHPC